MAEELIKAVAYICPVCKYEFFIYFDDLRKKHGFDGKNFNKLPKIDCHICHRSKAVASDIRELPDCYIDPIDIWLQ